MAFDSAFPLSLLQFFWSRTCSSPCFQIFFFFLQNKKKKKKKDGNPTSLLTQICMSRFWSQSTRGWLHGRASKPTRPRSLERRVRPVPKRAPLGAPVAVAAAAVVVQRTSSVLTKRRSTRRSKRASQQQ
jgi:hypothetical protein